MFNCLCTRLRADFFLESSPLLVCMETAYSRMVTSHRFLKIEWYYVCKYRIVQNRPLVWSCQKE